MKRCFLAFLLTLNASFSYADWEVVEVETGYPNSYGLAENSGKDVTLSVMCVGKNGPHIILMAIFKEFETDTVSVSWRTNEVLGEPSNWKVIEQEPSLVAQAMANPKLARTLYESLKRAKTMQVSFLDKMNAQIPLDNFATASREFDRKCGF